MDLLRQVLARLPLQQLIDLRIAEDETVVKARLRTVNYVTSVKFNSAHISYGGLCTLQGELSGKRILSPRNLCSRSAFLDQPGWFNTFSSLSKGEFDLEIVLGYGGPEIRELACRMIDPNNIWISDPSSIQWTETMKTAILTMLQPRSPTKAFLYGYLHYPRPLSDIISQSSQRPDEVDPRSIDIYEGYVKAAVDHGVTQSQEIDDAFFQVMQRSRITPANIRARLNKLGYFALNGEIHIPNLYIHEMKINEIVIYGIDCIQPNLLLPYLGDPDYLFTIETYFPRHGIISFLKDSIRRAEAMLALPVKFHPNYLTTLKILTGRYLTETDFARFANYPILGGYMANVAHPQFSKQIFEQFEAAYDQVSTYSTVMYDLVNYFKIVGDAGDKFGISVSHNETHRFQELVARGQLWQCWGTPIAHGFISR